MKQNVVEKEIVTEISESNKSFQKISDDYALFGIPAEQVPKYDTPQDFALSFKECSVVEYKSVSYSNSTARPVQGCQF